MRRGSWNWDIYRSPWTPKSHFNVSSILICSPRPIMPDSVARLQVDLGFNSQSTPSLLSPTARRNQSRSASFCRLSLRFTVNITNVNSFNLARYYDKNNVQQTQHCISKTKPTKPENKGKATVRFDDFTRNKRIHINKCFWVDFEWKLISRLIKPQVA